jgi:hypothetical protein
MIQLYDNETGARIGVITEMQLQFLIDQLEEETEEDQDYYIDPATLEMFESAGADPALLALLRDALGAKEEMEIRWSEE